MRQPSTLVAIAGALALAGCDAGDQPAAVAPTSPAVESTPSASPTVSIIRPDVAPTPAAEQAPEPLSATIGFPDGGAALDGAARAALDRVLAAPALAEGWPVVLRGHGDSVGHDGDNLVVSRRRAEAVADYLAEHGVDEARIAVIALGEQNPVAPNALPDGTPNEAGRARNRRVEITIAPPAAPAEADAAPQAEPTGAPARQP